MCEAHRNKCLAVGASGKWMYFAVKWEQNGSKRKTSSASKKVPARFELALLDSESNVLTARLRDPPDVIGRLKFTI